MPAAGMCMVAVIFNGLAGGGVWRLRLLPLSRQSRFRLAWCLVISCRQRGSYSIKEWVEERIRWSPILL